MQIRTSKQRNAIPLTKVGDFPYREIQIRILYFTKSEIWVGTPDGIIYKIGRPRRYAWVKLKRGDKKTIRVERQLLGGRKDKVENYYAYFYASGENNEIVEFKTKFNNMPK